MKDNINEAVMHTWQPHFHIQGNLCSLYSEYYVPYIHPLTTATIRKKFAEIIIQTK